MPASVQDDEHYHLDNLEDRSREDAEQTTSLLRASNTTSSAIDNLPPSLAQRRRSAGQSRTSTTMSLAGLKNMFFTQTITPVPRHPTNRSEPNTSISLDTESQTSQSRNEKPKKPWSFKVDARVISDATIGLSDGLTVPFALTAGLSTLGNTRVVIYGGFAELIAGAISMGLGGYLAAKSEANSYKTDKLKVQRRVHAQPMSVLSDIKEVFEPYDLPTDQLQSLSRHLSKSPKIVDFLMQFHECAEEPASSRAFTSAITIALGYFLGGLLPLIPYFCVGKNDVYTGLYISIGVMVVALFIFGYGKTCVVTGWKGGANIRGGCYGGVQMVVVGSAAAGAAMGLVKAFQSKEG